MSYSVVSAMIVYMRSIPVAAKRKTGYYDVNADSE